MSRASAALGLLDVLFDHSPRHLASVFTLRGIAPRADWGLTELALALSSDEAVWSQLSQLTSRELDALARLPQPAETPGTSDLVDALLAIQEGDLVYPHPLVTRLLSDHQKVAALSSDALDTAGEVEIDVPGVFGHLEQLEALVEHVRTHRVEAQKLPPLAQALDLPLDTAEALVDFAIRMGLIRRLGPSLLITPFAQEWLNLGAAEKWQSLLERFSAQLPTWWPRSLPPTLTPSALRAAVASEFPLVSVDDAELLLTYASWLGLIRLHHPTRLSGAENGDDRDAIIREVMPAAAEQMYPDGPDTIVAPGPLDTEKTKQLRQVGQWLSGGLAPRFRLSPHTINRALQDGLGEAEIHTIISNCVSGGMSSLQDMVEDTMSRARTLTIVELPTGTRVTSSDALTIQLVGADRRLAEARFTHSEGGGLTSALSLGQLHDLLATEGYPHLVCDAEGKVQPLSTDNVVSDSATNPPQWDEDAVARWQAHQHSLRRQPGFFDSALELAISHRTPIRVTVSMGETMQTMLIEPHALKNGRLRGRDVRSDVERTLPASHVVGISAGVAASEGT